MEGKILLSASAALLLCAACGEAAPYGLDATAGNAYSQSVLISGDACGIFADNHIAWVSVSDDLTLYGGSGYGARGRSRTVKTAVSVRSGGNLNVSGGIYGIGFSKKARGRFLASGDISAAGVRDNGIHGIDSSFILIGSSGDLSAESQGMRAVYLRNSASVDLSSDGSQTFKVNVQEIHDNNEVIKINNQASAKIASGSSQQIAGGSLGVSLSYDAEILLKAGRNQSISGVNTGIGLDGTSRAEISAGGDQKVEGTVKEGLSVGENGTARINAAGNQSFSGRKYGASFLGTSDTELKAGGIQSFSGGEAGLYCGGSAEASLSSAVLNVTGKASGGGQACAGILARGGSLKIAASDGALIRCFSATGSASAVDAAGTQFSLLSSGDVKISAKGMNACGVRIDAGTGTTPSEIAGRALDISASGGTSKGIFVSGRAEGRVSFNAQGSILIQAGEGVFVRDAVLRLSGGAAVISSDTAALAADGGRAELWAFSNCLSAPAGIAVSARNGGTVRVIGDEENRISGRTAVSAAGVESFTEIDGRLNVITGTELALHAADGGRVYVHGGVNQITGTILAETGGCVSVDFEGPESFFRGSVQTDGTAASRLAFSDGARWTAAGDSRVTLLELRRGAVADLRHAGTLTAEQLHGGDASFLIKLSGGAVPIRVTGLSSGIYDVYLDEELSDLSPVLRGEKVYFAAVPVGGAAFRAGTTVYVSSPSRIYDAACRVSADTGIENHWYFESEPSAGVNHPVNGNVDAALRLSQFQLFSAAAPDTYEQRTGGARNFGRGVWFRGKYSRAEVDGRFRSSGTMAQIGFDGGTASSGTALDYRRDSLDFRGISGSGSSRRLGVTAYRTLFGKRGQYADFTARAGILRSDYDVTLRNVGMISHGCSRRGYMSVSAEYGRRFDAGSGWFVTPQAQLQWTVLGGADFTASSGIAVRQKCAQSLIGRAGLHLGFKSGHSECPLSFSLRADVLHEFMDSGDFSAAGSDARYDGTSCSSRSWWELGVEFSVQTGRSSSLHADFSSLSGSGLSDAWRLDVGLRRDF